MIECYDYFLKLECEEYIDFTQFDDIFSPLLNDSKEFFEKIEVNGSTHFVAALSPFALFCKGTLEGKLACNHIYNIKYRLHI